MCFVIEKGQEKPYIASKDIRCYKVMVTEDEQYLRSLFQHSRYKMGIVYRRPFQIKLSKPRHYRDVINIGYHSYRSKAYAKECCPIRAKVVRCTIPKGTLFFKNKLEYVSNGIKVENVIHI